MKKDKKLEGIKPWILTHGRDMIFCLVPTYDTNYYYTKFESICNGCSYSIWCEKPLKLVILKGPMSLERLGMLWHISWNLSSFSFSFFFMIKRTFIEEEF